MSPSDEAEHVRHFVVRRSENGTKVEEYPTMREALQRQFDAERDPTPGVDVIALSAPSIEVMKLTHGSWFYTAGELVEQLMAAVCGNWEGELEDCPNYPGCAQYDDANNLTYDNFGE